MRNLSISYRPYEAFLVASAARTATGNSGSLDFPLLNDVRFFLNVTAASGTSPTLDVAIQVTPDNGTTWFSVLRFAQVTAAASRQLGVATGMENGQAAAEAAVADTGGALAVNGAFSKSIRILWTIGGTTPSFTFSVSAVGNHRA